MIGQNAFYDKKTFRALRMINHIGYETYATKDDIGTEQDKDNERKIKVSSKEMHFINN